jgi:His/Glu/Gln/Arg/opine family amino acid ABC transporter permease subunit
MMDALFSLDGFGDEIALGLLLTIGVGLGALVVALVFGLAGATLKLSSNRALNLAGFAYTTIVRGIPELVLIIVLYYGVPTVVQNMVRIFVDGYRLDFNPVVTAVLVIGLIYGAFMTEVLRGAFLAVPKGQLEAARAFGMSARQTFWRVHMPQMWRFALPGIGNVWMVLIKATALVSVVGLQDVLFWADRAGQSLREPFKFYFVAAAAFLLITFVSERIFAFAEARSQRGVRKLEA